MAGATSGQMGRSRALLTETDREYLSERDSNDNKRNQSVSRIRDRIDELPRDIEVLAEHHPGLLQEIREVVCEEPSDDDE